MMPPPAVIERAFPGAGLYSVTMLLVAVFL